MPTMPSWSQPARTVYPKVLILMNPGATRSWAAVNANRAGLHREVSGEPGAVQWQYSHRWSLPLTHGRRRRMRKWTSSRL